MTTINKTGFRIVFPNNPFVLSDCIITLGNFDGIHIAQIGLITDREVFNFQ